MVAMHIYRELYGQPRDAYQGTTPPAIAEIREPVRVAHMRRSGNVVLLAIADGNNVNYWRVTSPDDLRLQLLGADDRNQVQALAIAIKREAGDE